jgi:hypothetical protein
MSNTISLDSWLGISEQNNTITLTNDAEPEAKKIGGQTVVIHDSHCYVWIREGPWITAGREFGWRRKEPGFSVNRIIVEYADTHNLSIRIINATNLNKCYEISANNFIEFVNDTNSITEKYGAVLFVIPWSKCKTINQNVTAIVEVLMEGVR